VVRTARIVEATKIVTHAGLFEAVGMVEGTRIVAHVGWFKEAG